MPARAGYRFVPFDDETPPRIIEPPVKFNDLKLNEPHREGSVSGTLEATWLAETPVCIGVDGGNGIKPFEIDRQGCLPGASLRGMVRNVMEIAGFCHLGPINDHRHFGFRDFTDEHNYKPRLTQPGEIKAGWLSYQHNRWELTVAGPDNFYLVKTQKVLEKIGNPVTLTEWGEMDIHAKHCLLAGCTPNLLDKVTFAKDTNDATRAQFANVGMNGHLIVGGSSTARTHEVFIFPPSLLDRQKHVLHDDFMELFNRVNANPGRDDPEPMGIWRYWLRLREPNAPQTQHIKPRSSEPPPVARYNPPGIPVFFCGELSDATKADFDPGTSNFVMGLSRVIKIPYRESVGDIACRLYGVQSPYQVPKLKERFDLARAVFGWLDKAEDGKADEADALAGRVAFSPAFTVGEPNRTGPETFVFGAPRESFYPFYLNGDYHGDNGVPVGRKRYPVRSVLNQPNMPNANTATQSKVSFHACGTSYTGRIRIHNLHPVELAAFVWCLTFGQIKGPWRHSIGRAKGFGYGRLRLDSLAWVSSPKIVGTEPNSAWECFAKAGNWDNLSKQFETWMSDPGHLDCAFPDTQTIQRLRAYANPASGDTNSGNLAYPPVESFKNITGSVDDGEQWHP